MSPSSRVERPLTGATWGRGLRLRIYDHVFGDLHHEVGGFLLGDRDEQGRLRLTDAVPAHAADGRTASITFTQEDWAAVHAELEARDGDEQIMGWYHSHPGFGIFLSEFDLFIHRNFFASPGQVAYVVDPHAGREGLFGWREGDVALLQEGDTTRPGERPAPPESTMRIDATPAPPKSAARWGPRHYVPAAVAGIALGAGAWALFGGSSAPHATHHPVRPAAQRASRVHSAVRRTEGSHRRPLQTPLHPGGTQ